MISIRRRSLCPSLLAVVIAATGCSATDTAAGPAAPSPSGEAATYCRALRKRLPRTVDGLERGTTEPVSDFTAVWGDPAVQLRCGVSKPAVLTVGNEHYNPDADAVGVNGVDWFYEKRDDGARFTTVLRKAFVEVTVPGKYAPEVNALTDLADAVKKTIPVGI